MKKLMTWAVLGVLGVAIASAVSLITAVPVWLLWNAVIPAIFGLKQISFWQAVMLSLLCTCLFKSTSTRGSNK